MPPKNGKRDLQSSLNPITESTIFIPKLNLSQKSSNIMIEPKKRKD